MDKFNEVLKSVREIVLIGFLAILSVNLVTGCVNTAPRVSVKSVVSAALKDAYALGGATAVSNRIENLVIEGKITEEQAVQLHAIAQGVYERVIEHLDERIETVDEPCEDDANCGSCDACKDAD